MCPCGAVSGQQVVEGRVYISTVQLGITGAPWYVSNRQIHEDLGVPLLADHIRALTESFDSKLADVGNPLVRQLGRYLNFPKAGPVACRESQGRQGTADQSRRPPALSKRLNE